MSGPQHPVDPVDPAELPHDRWLSPLSYRYGSRAMRALWSEVEKRKTWRRVWLALAEAQAELGLFGAELLDDVRAHIGDVDVARAEALEAELKHDLVAELRVFAAQCPAGGRVLHLGATSMDIEDNADVMRMRDGLGFLRTALAKLLGALADKIDAYAEHATMGFTHLQPAEPTTLGYRFAQWGQDLLEDWHTLARVQAELRGKGLKGAVGTSASYLELLGDVTQVHRLEALVLKRLDLKAFEAATQTYPRKQDLTVVNALASLGQSAYRLAFDLRILQSPVIGELSEPFGDKQIGSSAMPFKRNPVAAENVDSLARQLAALPRVAWDNAAHSLLERTLDDSANRRSLLPEAFLLADTIVARTTAIVEGMRVEAAASERLLASYGVFAATEKVLMEATRAGGDRQLLHEVLRDHAMSAWAAVARGAANPLPELLAADVRITQWVPAARGGGDARSAADDLIQSEVESMLSDETLRQGLAETIEDVALPGLGAAASGKVREAWRLPGGPTSNRLLVTTDRVSAFDRVLGTIPFKGQVLNQLSAWWFERTRALVKNHMLAVPDANTMVVRDAEPLPVEVIVRGFLTGVTSTSLWTMYAAGVERPYGLELPAGMAKDDRLPRAVVTPTTKAEKGQHDTPLSGAEVVAKGLVPAALWAKVEATALALFAEGQRVAEAAGLLLVDTKYEMGLVDGELTLIDEVHTPDSSRYWVKSAWEARTPERPPEHLDKELLRKELAAIGYRGDGPPPPLGDELRMRLAARYVELYERLTGLAFEPARGGRGRVERALTQPLVPILMGSKSDLDHGNKVKAALDAFGIASELRVASAHKSPALLLEVLAGYEADPRPKLYVAIAGRSNALSGLLCAAVTAPVVSCPPYSDRFGGADVFSSLRMPSHVAPALVLDPENAGFFCAKVLGLREPEVRWKVAEVQAHSRDKLRHDDEELRHR